MLFARSFYILTLLLFLPFALITHAQNKPLTEKNDFEAKFLKDKLEKPPALIDIQNSFAHQSANKSTENRPSYIKQIKLFDIPVRWDEKLINYLNYYRNNPRGRATMKIWLSRLSRYRELILNEITKQKLPRFLIYVAMIESSYDPSKTSRVGAAGLWQFMKKTGKGFGLEYNYWLDERRDPEKSTRAALQYLKNLYQRFQSWDLALAAYNAGYGNILQAIRKYNTNDYWRLCRYEAGLPWSTSLYVPKIYAVAIIGENPKLFGYNNIKPDAAFDFDVVRLPRSFSLKYLASALKTNEEDIKRLNPKLRRKRTPPVKGFELRIPKNKKDAFYQKLANSGVIRYRPYQVKLGEDERSVAEHFGISIYQLRKINNFSRSATIRPGLTLLVPIDSKRKKIKTTQSDTDKKKELVAFAKECPTKIKGKKRVFYRVVLGDTLSEIAENFGVSLNEISRWNAIDPNAKLISKMVLQVFVDPNKNLSHIKRVDPTRVSFHIAGSRVFLNKHEENKGRRRIRYTVKRGDSLIRIARKFKLSVGSLMRINKFSRGVNLKIGDEIVVYYDPNKKKKRRRKTKRKKRSKQRSNKKKTRK